MTRDNWIIIGTVLATIVTNIILQIASMRVNWLNTSRVLNKDVPNEESALRDLTPEVNLRTSSVRYAPISTQHFRAVRIALLIINFIATFILVQTVQQAEAITRGNIVKIAICAAVIVVCMAMSFVIPLINNVYTYFEIVLGMRKNT